MRPIEEIGIDIIEASRDYNAILNCADSIWLYSGIDPEGVDEVMLIMRERLYSLYREIKAAVEARGKHGQQPQDS